MSAGRLLKLFAIVVAVSFVTGAVAFAWAWSQYEDFLQEPLDLGREPLTLRVQSGESVSAVLQRLERQGVTRLDWRWRYLLRREPVTIQVGDYAVPPGSAPRDLLAQLSRGEVIQYRFTVVEGWNYRQLVAAIQEEELLAVEAERLQPEAMVAELGIDAPHPEGWFLPETYAYTSSDTAISVLRRAHEAMRKALDAAWAARLDGLPLDSPYEMLILASIVEKESALASERPAIAGVFVRRLQQNWRLETDPTVIYGMGERYDGDIRRKDLREDTPYNTYVHRGLTPTPIAMPGRDALLATARPAEGTAMFFVADGTGGHAFSESLEAHNRAVRDLVRRQRAEAAARKASEGKTENPSDGGAP